MVAAGKVNADAVPDRSVRRMIPAIAAEIVEEVEALRVALAEKAA